MRLQQAYTFREENTVAIWATDESCVRDLKTFRMMPSSSKLMCLSFVLVPLGFTCVAYLFRTDGQEDDRIWGTLWGWLAGFAWLGYAKVISDYIRGYFAERRKIAPAPSSHRPELETMKLLTVMFGVLACLVFVLVLVPIHHTVHHPRERWAENLPMIVFFFLYLATYTRRRYWDAVLT
jgi:hypothetical protein